MANVISDETIEYVGILAKLELSPEEKEKLNSFITEYREEKTALDDTVKLLENKLDAAYKLAWGAVAVAVISLGLAVSTMVK